MTDEAFSYKEMNSDSDTLAMLGILFDEIDLDDCTVRGFNKLFRIEVEYIQ